MTTTYSVYLTQKQLILFLPESTEGIAAGATTAMDDNYTPNRTEKEAETVAK